MPAGKRHGLFLVISQQVNLVLANIGFQIAAADACSTIAATICRANGALASQCWNKQPVLTVMIGVAQLLLSQMKNLQAARATSAVGGAAAVVYCAIMFALAGSRVGNSSASALTALLSAEVPTGIAAWHACCWWQLMDARLCLWQASLLWLAAAVRHVLPSGWHV